MSEGIADYLLQSCSRSPLPDPAVRRLVLMSRCGHAHVRRWARGELVVTNMRLVASRAKAYTYSGIPYRDLMQRGVIGLMRAIDLYEWQKAKLSTYAALWIDAEIQRLVDTHRSTIRQPVERRRELASIMRTRHRLTQQLERPPTPGELEKASGVDRYAIDVLVKTEYTESLDESLFGPDGEERIAALADAEIDVEAAADVAGLWDAVGEHVAALAEVDARIPRVILEHYIGGRPFAELAQELGISRQRVGQIKERAIDLLRKSLSEDAALAEIWRTRECQVHNGGQRIVRRL